MTKRISGISPAWFVTAFAVLAVLFASSNLLDISVRFFIFLLLLTGLNFITGYARMASLAQAGLFGVGAYTAGILSVHGFPSWIAFILAPVAAALVATVVGVASLRLRGMYFVMATLGAGVIIYLLLSRLVDLTGGPNGLLGIQPLRVAGLNFSSTANMYVLSAVLAILGLAVAVNLEKSVAGLALRAVGSSEPAASASGISAFRLRLLAFVLSGLFAGLAGGIEVFYTLFISPSSFDFLVAVTLLVGLVLGGAGTSWGPVLGAILLILLEEAFTDYSDYEALIAGVIFVIVIQRFPNGIAGWFRQFIRQRVA